MPAARAVTVIPPTINLHTHAPAVAAKKRRTAGYARVSTDSDEQFTSYEAQIDYYTRYIKSNQEWEFVSVYTDEGISGTNTKRRAGFNQMIADALAGKIDLIVTKSVSRFARNTVDSLTTIRKLKEHGVEVYFEKENIWTFDSKGELLITIMSSLAQEESRSLSENITWGQRKRFSDGKVNLPYKQFLGYRKGPDGFPEVVEDEAKIVRRIYALFMEGKTSYAIAKALTADGVPTPSGKKKWGASVVESILTNEKYKGAALLQKCYTIDFLSKKRKVNEGEVQQYWIERSHQPIIQPHEFDVVQAEFARRKGMGLHYSGGGVFSSRLVCGDCGGCYGPKVWHSNSKYRRVVWQCNGKFSNETKCRTPHLMEEDIKARFLATFNQLLDGKDALLEDCRIMQDHLTNCSAIDAELDELLREIAVVTELTQRCIQENARSAQSQEEYAERYNGYVARYEKTKAKVDALQEQKKQRQAKADLIGGFMFTLHELEDGVTEFDNTLWLAVVQKATAYHDGRLVFTFQNGMEIEG